jgi:hypothetical protein
MSNTNEPKVQDAVVEEVVETVSAEEVAEVAAKKAEKAAKRKENMKKTSKNFRAFLWKTVNIKVLFLIVAAIAVFVLGFYAGEENYKRQLRNDYEKAIEDFADTWEQEWKEAFED